jgi:hypothetical protein
MQRALLQPDDLSARASVRSHNARRVTTCPRSGRRARTVDLTSFEHGEAVRLLAISGMLLAMIEENNHVADLVSTGFPAELRSMISATERHLEVFGIDGD